MGDFKRAELETCIVGADLYTPKRWRRTPQLPELLRGRGGDGVGRGGGAVVVGHGKRRGRKPGREKDGW